jgi:hypothetical protein
VTTSPPTDDAKILERGYVGSTADDSYNDRFDPTVYWDDLRIPVSSVRIQGSSNTPQWGAFKTGLQLLWFDPTTMEQVFFVVQMPHGYRLKTDLRAHVHWVPAANGSANQKVSWGLEYSLSEIGDVFPTTSTIYGNEHIPADTSVVADKHYLTPLGIIAGGNITSVSAMLSGRLFRDATGAGATDDYTADAGLLEIDFHYQMDSLGSRQIYIK